jgi:phenylacetate-CoA ligase
MKAAGRALAALHGLWRHSRLTRDDLVAFQNRRLRSLVAHAYHNVPYYRRLFDRHGLAPGDIRSIADLSAIPVTSRQDLQALPPKEVIARGLDPRRLITRTTSGSSGEPLYIHRTWLETRLFQAFRLRAMHDLGLRLTDKVATVLLTRHLHADHHQLALALLQSAGLYRHRRVSCLSPPERILSELRHFDPDILGGLPGVLSRVAETVETQGLPSVRPRCVVVGGEVLTPLMRRQIADAFHAPVFELYTSHECMTLAWECVESGDLHTSDDSVILEVLEDGSPVKEGERGEVIVTNLHAFAMPFIRYRLGDVVTKGTASCGCGSPFATIRAVQGRMIDYFLLPGGQAIHPYEIVLGVLGEAGPWLRRYQLLQERRDRVLLHVVPSRPPTDAELQRLRAAAAAVLGEDVEFRVHLVPHIPVDRTGKFRVTRSLVRSDYDGIDWNA